MAGIISVDEIAAAVVAKLTDKAVMVPRLMTIQQAATYLGMSVAALRAKEASGKIRSVCIDRHKRFDKADLDQLIENSKNGSA